MPLPEPPAASAAANPESDDVLARLPLSTRARNVLKAQRYTDWEALERLSEVADSEILRWPKVGHAVLHEIRTVLAAARPGPDETRAPSLGLQ
jgi:DNA-directed RNA polymerase alpha subunit